MTKQQLDSQKPKRRKAARPGEIIEAGLQEFATKGLAAARLEDIAKRAGIAHADTWWITCHHTELTDVTAIEDEMTPEADTLQTRRLAVEHNAPLALKD